jgi:hypothetical protein|tara:strand:- start:2177 stop:2593 length:417 start_codon:yes stop_codon:yes gene_type:complete
MKTFKELTGELSEKMTPSQMMQQRRKMGRRMKLLAKKSSTKMKKARNAVRRRSSDQLLASAKRQAKMTVIKKSLGPNVNYSELPMAKRIQIDQQIVAKKRTVIDKIAKKLLRGLKAGEGERVKGAKAARANTQSVGAG